MKLDHDVLIDKVRSIPKLIFTDDFEITVQSQNAVGSSFLNGEPSLLSRHEETWLSLRLQHQRRPGRAVMFYRDESSLAELVEMAFEASKHSSPDPWFRFPIWRSQSDQSSGKPLEPRDSFESHFEKLVWRPDSLTETYESSVLTTSIYRKSEKKALRERVGFETLRLLASQKREDQTLKMNAFRAAKSGKLDTERPLEELLRGIYYRKESVRYRPETKQRFVFGPQVVALLLRSLAPWFSAERYHRGISPLTESLGETLFSEKITLIDDPRHERAAYANRIDLEGTATQRSVLVERGKVTGLVYDAYHAAKENRLSTGNWYRPPKQPAAQLLPWHLTIQEGTHSFEELLGMMKDGVLIDYASHWDIDPAQPTQCLLVGSGWEVRAGAVERPLSNVALGFDLFDLLRQVASVGKTQTFFGDCAASAILIEELPLAN